MGVDDEVVVFAIEADVLFDFDSAELTTAAREVLNEIIATVESEPLTGRIDIAGHTDAIGTDAYNLRLSLERAGAVGEYLRESRPLAERVSNIEGFGESIPIAPNITPSGEDDPDGRALNRRVEIVVGR